MVRAAVWGEVDFGCFLQDPTGKTWRVDGMRGIPTMGEVLLSDREKQRIILPWPETNVPVTVVEPTEPEALAILEATVGAEVMGVQDGPKKPMRCKKLSRAKEKTIHAHMFFFHGVWTEDMHDEKHLRKLHEEDHEDPIAPHNYLTHIHE